MVAGMRIQPNKIMISQSGEQAVHGALDGLPTSTRTRKTDWFGEERKADVYNSPYVQSHSGDRRFEKTASS